MPYNEKRVAKDALEFHDLLTQMALERLSVVAAPAVASMERIESATDKLVALALGAAAFSAMTLARLPPDGREWVERNVGELVDGIKRKIAEDRPEK